MRRISQNDSPESKSRIPEKADEIIVGNPESAGLFRSEDGDEFASTCLDCPGEYCRGFSDNERPQGTTIEDVCPVDAITFNSEHTVMEVADSCFGCGLCVMRCPFDSIYMDDNPDQPKLGTESFDRYTQVSSIDHKDFFNQLSVEVLRADYEEEIIDRLVANSENEGQGSFYPLVASLLTSLGLPTTLPPDGDTNNRIDALSYHSSKSIPVEIKSPTETREINVKSVQQSIENKIVMEERHKKRYPSSMNVSTLVIGYNYPNERSDVFDLIEDCKHTYGISIGLLDLKNLYKMSWKKNVAREELDLNRILHLNGELTYEAL